MICFHTRKMSIDIWQDICCHREYPLKQKQWPRIEVRKNPTGNPWPPFFIGWFTSFTIFPVRVYHHPTISDSDVSPHCKTKHLHAVTAKCHPKPSKTIILSSSKTIQNHHFIIIQNHPKTIIIQNHHLKPPSSSKSTIKQIIQKCLQRLPGEL